MSCPNALDETYERVLRGINNSNRDHAHRLLQCLTAAVRSLRVEELAEVLAIDFDAARHGGIAKIKPNWRWADQYQAVLSICHSLVAIVYEGSSQVVQFSHFSVKEFLTSDRLARSSGEISRYHIPLSPTHTVFAQACLGVLLRPGRKSHVVRRFGDSACQIRRTVLGGPCLLRGRFITHTGCDGIFIRCGQATLGSMAPCLRHR